MVLQAVRYVSAHNPQRQPLGNGGLANARFTDQYRVVLGLAAQNTDHVTDLVITADNRVQLVVAGQFHQVGAVLFQRIIGFLGVVAGNAGCPTHGGQRLEEVGLLIVESAQQLFDPIIGLGADAQPHMLHGEVLVLHLLGAAFRLQQCLFHLGRNVDLVCLPARTADTGNTAQAVGHSLAQAVRIHAHTREQLGNQAIGVLQERGHQVLLLHLHMLIFYGQGLGALQRFHGLLGKLVHVHGTCLLWQGSGRGRSF